MYRIAFNMSGMIINPASTMRNTTQTAPEAFVEGRKSLMQIDRRYAYKTWTISVQYVFEICPRIRNCFGFSPLLAKQRRHKDTFIQNAQNPTRHPKSYGELNCDIVTAGFRGVRLPTCGLAAC